MKADESKCIGCKRCFPYCPLGRIQILRPHPKIPGRVYIEIDQDKCTDCGMCFRANVCAVDALYQPAEPWPREVRAVLSNPLIEYKGSQVPGRGTEEMKTNDVTGRFLPGEVGIGIELGRPGVATSFRDVEVVAMALAPLGYEMAEENPVTHFMSDRKTGKLRDDILDERAILVAAKTDPTLGQPAAHCRGRRAGRVQPQGQALLPELLFQVLPHNRWTYCDGH